MIGNSTKISKHPLKCNLTLMCLETEKEGPDEGPDEGPMKGLMKGAP